MNKSGIDLKQLIQRSASFSEHDSLAELDVPLDGELYVQIDSLVKKMPERVSREQSKAAKVWMAAAKFVTPAYAVAWNMAKDDQRATSIARDFLQAASKSAFESLLDAHSCGANFNADNMFGIYRYALANASNCASVLAYMHRQIIPQFSTVLNSHLSELATGYKPLSTRRLDQYVTSLTDDNITSQLNNKKLQKLLVGYVNAEYPRSQYGSETLLQVSLNNAMNKLMSNMMLRSSSYPNANRAGQVMEQGIIRSIEQWLTVSQQESNGGIFTGSDELTSVYAIQNALNMVTAVSSASVDRLTSEQTEAIYSPTFLADFEKTNSVLLREIIQTTNTYASAFMKASEGLKAKVEESIGPDTAKAPDSLVSPAGWLSLFDLPGKLVSSVASRLSVGHGTAMHTLDIIDSVDVIMEFALKFASALASKLDVWEPWAIKTITDESVSYASYLDRNNIKLDAATFENIAAIVESAKNHLLNDAGYKRMVSDAPGQVDIFQSMKTLVICSVLKMDAALTGHIGSKHKGSAISNLQQLVNSISVNQFAAHNRSDSSDDKTMMFGSIMNGAAQLVQTAIKVQYQANVFGVGDNLVTDLANRTGRYNSIVNSIQEYNSHITSAVNLGADRLAIVLDAKNYAKKPNAAPVSNTVPSHSGAAFKP